MTDEVVEWKCVICLNEDDDSIKEILPCAHLFHHKCIDEWRKTSTACPICRQDQESEPIVQRVFIVKNRRRCDHTLVVFCIPASLIGCLIAISVTSLILLITKQLDQ